ncbi:MAG: aspartate/glutamate racemase family protein [Candidatus Heimdallarchaeota archaeon]|nr:MAG: aspartate/glutamate racemase family protein [Candidatus Heimdallarchaeota archaeon]
MEIQVIIPILYNKHFEEVTLQEYKARARPDTNIAVVSLGRGPASIESMYDEQIASPWILNYVLEAEKKAFDAVIINCMGDPALYAAREIAKIPIVGPGEASLALAYIIGHKYSVLVVLKKVIPRFENKIRMYGFSERLASVRSIEIPVLQLENEEKTFDTLLAEARKAVEEDGADTLILGCTGMLGVAKELQETLGIPVIDPTVASLKMAETLVDMGISQSKRAYPYPPEKTREL